jgi:hypothetical protein
MDEAEALFPADEAEEAVTVPGDESGGPDSDGFEEAAVAGDETLDAPLTDVDEDAEPETGPDAAPEVEPEAVVAPEPVAEPMAEESSVEEAATPTLDEMVAELAGSETTAAHAEEPAAATAQEVSEEPEEVAEPAVDEGEPDGEAAAPLSSVPQTAPGPIGERMWTRAPFWVAFGLFPVFTGVFAYLLWPAAAGALTMSPLYPSFVLGGAGLVLVSLVTGLVVGLTARAKAGHDGRVGLARAIWWRTFVWTAAGVAVWWIGMVLLDLHHAGVI